jgi:hypothetical protein
MFVNPKPFVKLNRLTLPVLTLTLLMNVGFKKHNYPLMSRIGTQLKSLVFRGDNVVPCSYTKHQSFIKTPQN